MRQISKAQATLPRNASKKKSRQVRVCLTFAQVRWVCSTKWWKFWSRKVTSTARRLSGWWPKECLLFSFLKNLLSLLSVLRNVLWWLSSLHTVTHEVDSAHLQAVQNALQPVEDGLQAWILKHQPAQTSESSQWQSWMIILLVHASFLKCIRICIPYTYTESMVFVFFLKNNGLE